MLVVSVLVVIVLVCVCVLVVSVLVCVCVHTSWIIYIGCGGDIVRRSRDMALKRLTFENFIFLFFNSEGDM